MKKTVCIGAGPIGTSWALNFAWKNTPAWLYDIVPDVLAQSKVLLKSSIDTLVEHQVLSPDLIEQIYQNIHFTNNLAEALEGADYIQECGPEHYEAKWAILKEIEAFASPVAIIATSTSGLLVTQLAQHMIHPHRLVGAHPYNPPHLLPLVELTHGEKTSQDALMKAYQFYQSLGKKPVIVQKEVNGFIANRIQIAVIREIVDLVKNGVCTLEDADDAMLYGPGLRWGLLGPMAVLHLGGGPGGIYDTMLKQQSSYDLRLADMADWKQFPDDLPQLAKTGMDQALQHRNPTQGQTIDDMSAWRDASLIQLLKLHDLI